MIEEQIIKELSEAIQEAIESYGNNNQRTLAINRRVYYEVFSLVLPFVSSDYVDNLHYNRSQKTTGGKGVNRPVDKGSNPFK